MTRRQASVATAVSRRALRAASDSGRQASSHRTVCFWMGYLSFSGRPRTEPIIFTHNEYWVGLGAETLGGGKRTIY